MYLKIDPQIHWDIRIFFDQKRVFQQPVRGTKPLTEWIKKWHEVGKLGIWSTVIFFVIYFFAHIFFVAPVEIIREQNRVIQNQTNTISSLTNQLQKIANSKSIPSGPQIISLTQLLPADIATISKISELADKIEQQQQLGDLITLQSIGKSATNETVKKYADNKMQEIVNRYANPANPKTAITDFYNRYTDSTGKLFFGLNGTKLNPNAEDIIKMIRDMGRMQESAKNFVALREITGVTFPMFDFDAVNEWSRTNQLTQKK